MGGCEPVKQSGNAQSPVNVANSAQNVAAPLPLPVPPMDRAALLLAVAKARSAAAAGTNDREAQAELDGKEFEVRIRFGCEGPAAKLGDSELGWTFDAEKRVLRIRAAPTVGLKDSVVAAMKPEDVEAVEGFWFPRPWLLQSTCPAKLGASNDDAAKAQSQFSTPQVGIARFFTATDTRTGRRDGRPYEATKTLESVTGVQGFDLVLSGRLQPLAGGRVIGCLPAGSERAPDCLIAARVDSVRFEQPGSHETIAEWTGR